jgi:autotransporter-associated beta strand protein
MIVLNPNGEGKIAAVQQNGGSVCAQGNPTANFYLFGAPRSYSQGYWEVAGGTLCLTGRISMCGDRSAVALRQSGGKIIHRNSSAILRIGAGAHAYAEYIMTGGKSEFLSVNLRDWGNFVGTTSTLTVDGEDAVFTVLGNLQIVFQNTSNPVNDKTYGILNLVSGTFCANSAVRGGGNDIAIERTMTHGLINFNGGTFKTRIDIGSKTSDGLFGGTPDQATKSWVDYVTVYSGGATIETDSNNRKVYIRTPLRKPTGKGIRSITPLCKRTKLIAPPHVIIEGDGQGASAYAEFDKEKGEVTGIRIASPGWGYTAASARLLYGSPNFNKGDVCSVELADVESGDFTKAGPGTLVLAAANSYTGETILKGGTLELSAAGALPETSAVSYQGGALTSTAEAFPEILRVRIPGAENGTVRRLKLATFIDACPSVLPDVELVNVSDDENRNWVPEFRGSSLYVRRVFGTVLSVR